MPHIKRFAPTLLAIVLGIAGILVILYAWQLPPFASDVAVTKDAYVRGRITSIAPQLSGYVAEVPVSDFQPVEKGEVVVRLKDDEYQQKLAQAQAKLDAARAARANGTQRIRSAEAALETREAELQSARASQEAARTDWGRINRLSERGVASDTEVDDTHLALRLAEASVAQAKAQISAAREEIKSVKVQRKSLTADVASAEAAVELARIALDNTVIRAPETGRLGQVNAQIGQYVSAGSTLAPLVGQGLWVMANFKETQLHGMENGQQARFTVDALQDAPFAGHIARFAPATASEFSLLSGNNATGNFTKIAQRLPVRIAIEPGQEQAQKLAPGLSVVVRIDTSEAAGDAQRRAEMTSRQ